MLIVECVITVKDQAYEGGVKDAEAFSESSWASGAPASFASSHPDTITMLIDSAVQGAVKNAANRLAVLKGSGELSQQDTRSTQKPIKSDLKNATTEATQERKEDFNE